MREVLTTVVIPDFNVIAIPQFNALVCDDTGLIFKEKRSGEWLPRVMLRYKNIDYVEFHGGNVIIVMKNGDEHIASVFQRAQLFQILEAKDINCIDYGKNPFYLR